MKIENVALEKLVKKLPQTLLLLNRKGPRGPHLRLSQHYIGPKMTFSFFKFLQKKVSQLDKKGRALFCIVLGGYNLQKSLAQPLDSFSKCRKII